MKNKIIWAVFLIAFFGAYASIFPGGFHYDDYHSIRNNSWLVSPENIPKFFGNPIYFSAAPRAAMYRPLLLVTYAINYQIYGWRPWGWHITNLLMHLINSVMVLLIVYFTFRRERLAWIAAALYAFHPIAAENVNYINCRSSIMCTGFMLAGLIAIYKLMQPEAKSGKKILWIFLANLFFILGMLSKDSAVVFPGMAAIYFWIFCKDDNRKKIRSAAQFILPMAAVLFGYLLLRNMFFSDVFTGASLPRSRLENLFTELKSYFWYIGLYLWPVRLGIEHSFQAEAGLGSLPVLLSLLGLAGLAAMVAYALLHPQSRVSTSAFFIAFYILALLPTSSIVPLNVLVSERAAYPALFGLAGLGALLLDYLFEKRRAAAMAVFTGIMVFYSLILFSRGRVWQSEYRIWSNAYELAPDNARVLGELGRKYFAKGEDEKALRYILRSDELATGQPTTLFNLATIYMDFGQLDKAEIYFKRGLEQDPEDTEAMVNLAEVYKAEGEIGLAIFQLEKAIDINPNDKLAHNNLADLYVAEGKIKEAESECRKALAIDPNLEMANFNLGMVLAGQVQIRGSPGIFYESLRPEQRQFEQCALGRDHDAQTGQACGG